MKKQPTDIKNEENESADVTDNQDERRISDELRKQLEASDPQGALSKTRGEYHRQNSLSAIVRKHSEELHKTQTEKYEHMRKELIEMQKQGSFGALYRQIENIQKQTGLGGSLHKQMEEIKKKLVLVDYWKVFTSKLVLVGYWKVFTSRLVLVVYSINK